MLRPSSAEATPKVTVLSSVGRFWPHEPRRRHFGRTRWLAKLVRARRDGDRPAAAAFAADLRRTTGRKVVVPAAAGPASPARGLERLRGERHGSASGSACIFGKLEGRIRKVVDELANTYRTIWYIPDIVQVAMSRTPPRSERDHARPDRSGDRRGAPRGLRRDDAQGSCAADADQAVAARPFRDDHHRALARQRDIGARRGRARRHGEDDEPAFCSRKRPGGSRRGRPIPFRQRSAGLCAAHAQADRAAGDRCRRADRTAPHFANAVAALRPAGFDPRHQGTARPQSGAQFFCGARHRAGRSRRGDRGPHRHAESRPQRSQQTDWRLFCLPDRPAPARPSSQRRSANFCSARSSG